MQLANMKRLLALLPLVTSTLASPAGSLSTDPSSYSPQDVIYRDVAIIGGGSSGTYTGVRLKDHNKSVVIVERNDYLGGHAQTYTVPGSGFTIDYGVIVFENTKTVKDYFSRFNVSLTMFGGGGGAPPTYVDFSTGKQVTNVTAPSNQSYYDALEAYKKQLARFPALKYSFNVTHPIEPDLLLPFGDFVAKYNLGAMMHTVFADNQGYAPLLNITTLYMLKYLNEDEVDELEHGGLTTKNHNIQELYRKAAASLGSENVLFNSSVLAMARPSSSAKQPIRILVNTPSGRKLIVARKLVSTAPPVLNNLVGYDLSTSEVSLFRQFKANGYYTGILNNTGLPSGTSLSATGPGRPFDVPALPGPYSFRANPGAPGLTQVYYASPQVLPDATVQADILRNLERYKQNNGLAVAKGGQAKPSFVVFSSHSPFNLHVDTTAINAGFYDRLFALQGQRGTFYNGAAWNTQDSSVLWGFTEAYVLPKVLAALG